MPRLALLSLACLLTACTATKAQQTPLPPAKLAPLTQSVTTSNIEIPALEPINVPTVITPLPGAIPPSIMLEVPFSSQAPHGNWDEPYQNACEEMSLLMVTHFLGGTSFADADQADREVKEFTTWMAKTGHGISITLEELARIAEQRNPAYRAVISEDVSLISMQRLLAAGKPIIVPAAGRMLGNPFFNGDGPWYHMLVVVGYDREFFYTNDPGTGKGKLFQYRHDVLLNAIHDWTGKDELIAEGNKRLLTLELR